MEQLVIPLFLYAKGDIGNVSNKAILEAFQNAGVVPTEEKTETA